MYILHTVTMKRLDINNVSTFLIFLGNIVFLIMFIMLWYYNRIAADDFFYLSNVRDLGIVKGTIHEYNLWSTRFPSVFILHIILQLYLNVIPLLLTGFLVLLLLFFSLKYFLNVSGINVLEKRAPFISFNLIMLVISGMFWSSVSIAETWFFICSMCTYLLSIIALIAGIGSLHDKNKLRSIIISIISFAYIGGSLGPLALVCILGLIGFLFSNVIKKNSKKIRIAAIGLIACLIFFMILYNGHGNENRESFFNKISIIDSVLLNFKITARIFLQDIVRILPFLIPFSIILVLFLNENNNVESGKSIIDRKRIVRFYILLAVGVVFLVFIYQLPITYKTQDKGALRALFPVTIFLFAGVVAGIQIIARIMPSKMRKILLLLCSCLLLIFNSYKACDQFFEVREYAQAYDNRMIEVKTKCLSDQLIVVEPLPESGLLHSAEISTDTNSYLNKHFINGLGISCPVCRSKQDRIQ